MDHAPAALGIRSEDKLLVVVLFTLVLAEVGAVEVEQTVGQFVASQGPQDECRFKLVVKVQKGHAVVQAGLADRVGYFYAGLLLHRLKRH